MLLNILTAQKLKTKTVLLKRNSFRIKCFILKLLKNNSIVSNMQGTILLYKIKHFDC